MNLPVSRHAPATELLSPAGDWESLRAAVAAGANAVYFGLSNFNARHRATNFSVAELPQVMEYLHARSMRGYVTLNTLIFTDELAEVSELVAAIARAGADAVIVQDLGLTRLIRRLAPELAIHGSTQMTLTEPRGIEFVRTLGVERVIVARELSIAEIRAIRAETSMPIEVFVHGALCVAYSGQCLTSEALGGRSANRGQCAQACRLPYDLIVDGQTRDLGDVAYLLSPQDLAAHDLASDLVDAGVVSFKIEGRLKTAHYVAATTRAYRAALDAAHERRPFRLTRQEQTDLAQSFSRGFTPGFLAGADHQALVAGRFPKSRGVRVGQVVGHVRDGVRIALDSEHDSGVCKPGDGVVFDEGHPDQLERGGRLYEVRARRDGSLELIFARDSFDTTAVALNSLVWKTDDPEFRRRIERIYAQDRAITKSPITAHFAGRPGEPLQVALSDAEGHTAHVSWPGPLQRAERHPLDETTARAQFGRLGDTPFELISVTIDAPEPIMTPRSVLNELRRNAVSALTLLREQPPAEPLIHLTALNELRAETASHASAETDLAAPRLYVLVRTLEQLDAALIWNRATEAARLAMIYADFEDVRRYRDAVARGREHGMLIGLATLRVIKPGEEGLLRQIGKARPDAVLARNLAAISLMRAEFPQLALVGDFSLNVANELTAAIFREQGLARLTPSYDLNWEQLAAMLRRFDSQRMEVVIHQHMPMFHMEHCVFAHTMSDGRDWRDCGRPCDRHRVELRDRSGAEFPLLPDTGCRNTVFNAVPQSGAEYVPRMLSLGLRHFRVELLRESAAQAGPLLDHYRRVLDGLERGQTVWRGLQVLNQLGVTRGTFQQS